MKPFLLIPITAASIIAADILSVNFDNHPVGIYTVSQLKADWNNPSWNDGVDEGRCRISDTAASGKALAVQFPAASVGPSAGGAQWKAPLGGSWDSLYVEYKIMFPKGFQFAKGGKLPGLGGGTANTGGSIPTGTDGYTARLMWRTGTSGADSDHGYIVNYLYHVGQPSTYGDDRWWINPPRDNGIVPSNQWDPQGVCYFEPGIWHTVRTFVKMNTIGSIDGVVRSWFDGELVLDADSVEFRRVGATFGIDLLYFSTFFGGSDASWASPVDQTIYFDEFRIFTEPETTDIVQSNTPRVSPTLLSVSPQEFRFGSPESVEIMTVQGRKIPTDQRESSIRFHQPLTPGIYIWKQGTISGAVRVQ